jgi:hypothetical protein
MSRESRKLRQCFVIIRKAGASFFPIDRKGTRRSAEREKRRLQRSDPHRRYAIKNVCDGGRR